MNKLKVYYNIIRRVLIYHIIWRVVFLFACIRPVKQKQAVFAYNKNYSSLPDNLREIKEVFQNAGWNCIEFGSPAGSSSRVIAEIKFQILYAQSAVIFLNDNFDPVCSNKPRKGTRVVQLWHACGAFKKFGYSTLNSDWGGSAREWKLFPRHNRYTDAFVSAESVIPCYAEAFNCSEDIIKPLGVPRTDVFFDKSFVEKEKNSLKAAIPEIGDRKIILYAPTFRGNTPTQAHNDNMIDFEKFRVLSEKCVIVLKYHPFTSGNDNFTAEQKEEYGDFVYLCPANIKIDSALCAADLIISDYSSLIFEASLLDRPMIFFAYDLEEYDRSRSYYFKYEDFVPGPVVKTDDELLSVILNGVDKSKVSGFREKYMSACDGNCTRKISEYVMSRFS